MALPAEQLSTSTNFFQVDARDNTTQKHRRGVLARAWTRSRAVHTWPGWFVLVAWAQRKGGFCRPAAFRPPPRLHWQPQGTAAIEQANVAGPFGVLAVEARPGTYSVFVGEHRPGGIASFSYRPCILFFLFRLNTTRTKIAA